MVPIELYKADFYDRELRICSTEMNTDILQQLANISALAKGISTVSTVSTIVNRKKMPTMCELNCLATKAESSDSEEYY